MNAAAAGLKGSMKERFKQNSEQEINPMTNTTTNPMFTSNPGAARNLVVLRVEEKV